MNSSTLRPGVAIPVVGYLGSLAMAISAVVVVATPGAHNHSVDARWFGGQIIILISWALYKLGSNRIILDGDVMRVLSWGLTWTVRRGEVRSVELSRGPRSLSILLTDGSALEPVMFMTSPFSPINPGGSSSNIMSRRDIRDRIIEWNAEKLVEEEIPSSSSLPERRWRIRYNLTLLLALSVLVAVEAIALTLANIWLNGGDLGEFY